jgi:teichuronic acid biosynthesis glycosyltransferase TuaG
MSKYLDIGRTCKAPVSVIIPCYCCADTIERAVVSVMKQTVLPEEVWLVDDASPDKGKTLDKLKELKWKYGSITHINVIALHKNGGPSVARNVGWDVSTQPYIAFLDSDDSWHSRKIEIQYGWMEKYPHAAATGHKRIWVRRWESIEKNIPGKFGVRPVKLLRLMISNCFATSTMMLRREIPYRFEAAKRYSEDYLLWLMIASGKHKMFNIGLPLAFCYKAHFGSSGLSADLWKMEKGQLDTYYRLKDARIIPVPVYILLIMLSLLRYFRRLAITYKRRILQLHIRASQRHRL